MKIFLQLTSRRSGSALIIVLAMVVLITSLIVAFFSSVTANRFIEASRVDHTQADLLAQTAGEYVTGLFLDEIRKTANSTATTSSGVTLYTPISAIASLPARTISSALPASNPDYYNLIRQSIASADSNASTHSVTTPARNSRSIGAARWNAPKLLTGNGFTGTTQLPNWIYLTDNAGVTTTLSVNVIGRFAYNVYDTGGLLNANVAGFPSLSAPEISQLKGSLAGADLTALSLQTADVNALVSFRNPAASGNAATYFAAITDAAHSGFLSVVTTHLPTPNRHNYFTSRQDLIRYVSVRNAGLSPALPYLTHFSRAVTAPSWSPASPTTSNPNIPNVRFSAAPVGVHYRDDGTTELYEGIRAGTPLLQRRFSLAKLAWLGPSGPNAAAFSASVNAAAQKAAIRQCFGLEWNASKDRWDYMGSDGETTPQLEFKTLASVAANNREPNFFEMLKAGILEGSVGTVSTEKTYAGTNNQVLEANKDFQVLRIGACIIDQADRDNYPTILSFDGNLEAAGVEDLPYFYDVCMSGLRQTNTVSNKLTSADLVWAPVFFNPHRPSSPTEGPVQIVMDVARGTLTGVEANSHYELQQTLTKDLSTLPGITIPSANFALYRLSPQPSRNATAVNSLGNLVSYASADKDIQVFKLFSYQTEYTAEPWPATRPDSDSAIFGVFTDDLILRLQFQNAQGHMKTYATFAGHEAMPDSGWKGLLNSKGNYATYFGPQISPAQLQFSDLSKSYYVSLWDPRTNRLGPNRGLSHAPSAAPALTGTADVIRDGTPFSYTYNAANPIHPALWPQGGKAAGSAPSNYADSDNVFRPADGWLGDAANLYRNLADYDRRPVILQRPFQSVAELGYVFRDVPWKTLSFFDATSGDAALLDLFSVVDEPAVTAGRVNLNTRHSTVLQALLKGGGQMADGTSTMPDPSGVATAYNTYAFASGQPTVNAARNVAGLATFMSAGSLPSTLNKNKPLREAVVRALGSTTQTRTWNLLIDVVAQSGKFAPGGTAAGNFIVEGEKRYWLSIAIDRYTGKVVDQQWEAVYE
ncbi:MAG: hypothetical protein B9S32_10815 [Verrucomicrobia bacterium Tous-C9LFEB]|nr:MAG: hypothetical protein B9S32_10815 [Verrucomicrobia bacterium Tous-C9LFEB]